MATDLNALWTAASSYKRLTDLAERVAAVDPRGEDAAQTKALTRLDYLAEVISNAEALVADEVKAARESGASWSQIGVQLGISKQAAQQRHGAHS